MMVDRRWPAWNGLAMLGDENSTIAFFPLPSSGHEPYEFGLKAGSEGGWTGKDRIWARTSEASVLRLRRSNKRGSAVVPPSANERKRRTSGGTEGSRLW
jgi:hypothetical protein